MSKYLIDESTSVPTYTVPGLFVRNLGGPNASKKPGPPRKVNNIADEVGVTTNSMKPIIKKLKKIINKDNSVKSLRYKESSINDPKASELKVIINETLIPLLVQNQQEDKTKVTKRINDQQIRAISTIVNLGKVLEKQANIIKNIDRNGGNMLFVLSQVLQGKQ